VKNGRRIINFVETHVVKSGCSQNRYHQKHSFGSKCTTSRLLAGPLRSLQRSLDPVAELPGPPGRGKGKGRDGVGRNGEGNGRMRRVGREKVGREGGRGKD